MTKIRNVVQKSFERFEKVPDKQAGFLGRADGVVRVPGKRHWVYARLWNGDIVEAYNQSLPANFGLAVDVIYRDGRFWAQAKQVYNEVVNTSIPDGIEEELQWPNQRALYVRPEQFLSGLVYPKSGLVVYVCGGNVPLPAEGYVSVPHQEMDLTPYLPVSGAVWAVIALEIDGTASVTTGGAAASWAALSLAEIPFVNGYAISAIRLYNGQTNIQHGKFGSMIEDLRWFRGGGGGIPDAPSDNYLYGRKNAAWGRVDGVEFDAFTTEEGITYSRTSGGSYTYTSQRILVFRPIRLSQVKWDIRSSGTHTLSIRKGDGVTELESIAVSAPGTSRVTFTLSSPRILNPGSYVLRMTAPSSVQWYDYDSSGQDVYYDGWGAVGSAGYETAFFAYRLPITLVYYNSSQGNVTNTTIENVRFLLPFGSYTTFSPVTASPGYPFSASFPSFTIYPKQWSQGLYIGATNDASNYWTVDLLATISGTDQVVATFNTIGLTKNFSATRAVTTFSQAAFSQANIRFAIRVTKTGNPAGLFVHAPALEYTLA